MAYQGPHQGGGHPPPLFAAELDGGYTQNQQAGMPMSPDGAPIFEMPAESAPAAPRTSAQKQPQRKESEPTQQANPWPYHGPGTNDDRPSATVTPPIAAQDFAPGGTTGPGDSKTAAGGMERSSTVASTVSAPDVPHGTRPSTVSPVSPSDGHFFPAPLQISKPSKPTEPKYKPYSPEMSHEFQDAGRPPATSSPPPPGQTATVAYRPYRRPSYKESPAPASTSAQSPSISPGPASPPLDAPKTSGTPPYPMGTAPHHFYMPASPAVPEDTRPSISARPDQRHSPLSAQGTGHSAATSPRPLAASPVPSESKNTVIRPAPEAQFAVHHETQPEEIVLWPHPPEGAQANAAAAPAPAAPVIPPQHTRPPAPPQTQHQHLSPTHTGTSSTSPVYGHPHPQSPPAQGASTTSPGYAPQTTYASSAHSASPATSPPPQSYNRPQASPRPSKFPTVEPQDPIPEEPPPAYADIAPPRPGSQPPANEKPSLFPQAPSSAPQTPMPQQHPQQPTYASSSSSTYAQPPSHQAYGGPQQNLHPPPLPPRPSSSHSNSSHHNYPPQPTYASSSSQPPGFSGPAAPPGSFPPPPKTNYVPQHPPPGAPGHPRPSYANAYGNKFLGGSAKKWLDKTNQFVEHKIGEVLQNHPDPKYRPQPGTYGYQGGHQQHSHGPPGAYPQGQQGGYGPPQGQYGPPHGQYGHPQGYPQTHHQAHPQAHPQQPQYAHHPGQPGPRR